MSEAFPPPDPAAAAHPPVYTQPTPTPKRRSKAPLAIGALAVVALVGGGAFAVASMSDDDDGGAESPEAAVDALFSALGDEDVLGVLDTLAPGERESFSDSLSTMVDELGRLGVLSDDIDLSSLEGFDLEFSDLTYSTEDVAAGLATVEVTGGMVDGSYDLSQLPIGDTIVDTVLGGERPEGTEDADAEPVAEDGDLRITTVERDGGWYVSLWYSVAEAARVGAGLEPPALGQGVAARGADSPEAAVEALVQAAVHLDLEGVIAILPPDEMGALHDYAPLFLPQAEEAVAQLDFQASVTGFEASADVDGDVADVTVEAFDASLSADGQTASLSYDGECADISLPDQEDRRVCPDDATESSQEVLGELGLEGLFEGGASSIRAVKVDGKWYVSPTRTSLGFTNDVLAGIDEDAFRDLLQRVSDDPEAFAQELLGAAISSSGMDGGSFGISSPSTTNP